MDIISVLSYVGQFWTLLTLFLVLLASHSLLKSRRLPPGPYGLPFLGYAPFMNPKESSREIDKLCKYYRTDILSITSYGMTGIFLNSMEIIKELFQRRTDLVDRQEFKVFSVFDPEYTGIIAVSGELWKETRRFTLSMMRTFGMGKSKGEQMTQHESEALCDILRSYGGRPIDANKDVKIAVSNIICAMVFGQTFSHEDREFVHALQGMDDLMKNLQSPILFLLLKTSLGKCIYKKKHKALCNYYRRFSTFVKRRIEEHQQRYNGTVGDLIDGYLQQMKIGDPEIFNSKNLQFLITDLFLGGSETTSTTLAWVILCMAAFPLVQNKVYKELAAVIGPRTPSMADKKNTPYSEATLSEVQRYRTLLKYWAAHTNIKEDININGYTIPRNTFIVANVQQLHRDPEIWKNPEEFDPENFLENGRIINLDRLVPFSVGRRACAGESLARVELYIFFTSLVKEFEIKLETDDSLADLEGLNRGTFQPKPYKVRMVPRS